MKTPAERAKDYRNRKKEGVRSVGDRVGELEWKVKALQDQIVTLQGVVDGLVAKPISLNVTPNNALAQLRAQINAVPVRPYQVETHPTRVPLQNPPNMPVQPYGEWEPS